MIIISIVALEVLSISKKVKFLRLIYIHQEYIILLLINHLKGNSRGILGINTHGLIQWFLKVKLVNIYISIQFSKQIKRYGQMVKIQKQDNIWHMFQQIGILKILKIQYFLCMDQIKLYQSKQIYQVHQISYKRYILVNVETQISLNHITKIQK